MTILYEFCIWIFHNRSVNAWPLTPMTPEQIAVVHPIGVLGPYHPEEHFLSFCEGKMMIP